MKYRLIVVANFGLIIGIIMGLYFSKSIILFLSIFVISLLLLLKNNSLLSIIFKWKRENKSLSSMFLKCEKDNKSLSSILFKWKRENKTILSEVFKFSYSSLRYLKKYLSKTVLITFIFFLIIGYLLLNLKLEKFQKFLYEVNSLESIKVYGIIASDKEEKEYSNMYKLKILNINNKRYYNTYCYIKFNKKDKVEIKYGDLIYFKGEFEEAQDSTNYKGFSYKEYLKTINIYGTFKVSKNKVKVLGENALSSINMLSNKVKNSFEIQLDKLYGDDNEEKALLKGILIGEVEEITEEQTENFKATSLSHILAVSGMHISYIIICSMFILRLLGFSKKSVHILTICIIIFFMFLTNFAPSVVRASIMGIIFLISFLVKRKSDFWVNISIASLITLIYNPYILLSLSYQLSYLGTIGIVLGMKVVGEYKRRKEEKQNSKCLNDKTYVEMNDLEIEKKININDSKVKFKKVETDNKRKQFILEKFNTIKQFFIDAILVCISAQLFVFPIILLNFNNFSIYFLISNILVAPIIGVIVILGFIIIFISYIFPPLAIFLNYIENFLLEFINIMTNYISKLPNANLYLKTPYVLSILLYFVFVLIFIGMYIAREDVIKRKVKQYYKQILKIFKIILVCYIIIVISIDIGIYNFNTKVYFVDVGQGDCSLIITEKNKKILIDGGGSESYDVGENTTLPYLLDRRISKLDYIIISHFDSDHVQGLFAVLENIKVVNVILSKQYEMTENYEKFLSIVKEKKINLILAKKGDVIKIDKHSYIEVLFPLENVKEYISQNAINNNSLVFKYKDRNISILYTGDIEKIAEEKLLSLYRETNKLEADILKVAHHGSKTSTIESFLELVNPKIAVISVGKNNTFGHPSEEVLARLKDKKVVIRRTDLEGEILMKFGNTL